MTTPIGINAVEERLRFLDDLPDTLYDAVVGGVGTTLEERVQGVLNWRRALLEGKFPDFSNICWPPHHYIQTITEAMNTLGILRFFVQQEALVDEILASVLALVAITRNVEQKSIQMAIKKRLETINVERVKKTKKKLKIKLSDTELEQIREQVQENHSFSLKDQFINRWKQYAEIWASLEDIFGAFNMALSLGWDLSRASLKYTGWSKLSQLQELLKKLSALRNIIETLGRWHTSLEIDGKQSEIMTIFEKISIQGRWMTNVSTPLAPQETKGVTRSGEIGRMLPSEYIQLRHPTLRWLWHARRAERALNCYLVEGVMQMNVHDRADISAPKEISKPAAKKTRGPIMVCLDTSGSMAGLPEIVAKALVLESMRVAHAESRRCYLFMFSGPKDVREYELSLTPDGLDHLLNFLTCSFHGGTDLQEPIQRVAKKLEGSDAQHWHCADVLLITDGLFDVTNNIKETITLAKEKSGLQVHGILLGHTTHQAMNQVCDRVHVFSDWRKIQN